MAIADKEFSTLFKELFRPSDRLQNQIDYQVVILTTPNLELYREWNSLIHNSHLLCGNIYNPFRI